MLICSFSRKSISETRQRCWVSEGCSQRSSSSCADHVSSSTPTLEQTMSSRSSHCARDHGDAETCLGTLDATAYEDVLDFLIVCFQLRGGESAMGVKVRSPCTFGHLV